MLVGEIDKLGDDAVITERVGLISQARTSHAVVSIEKKGVPYF